MMNQFSYELAGWTLSFSASAAMCGYLIAKGMPDVFRHSFLKSILSGILIASFFFGFYGTIEKHFVAASGTLPEGFLAKCFSVLNLLGYYSILGWTCCIAHFTSKYVRSLPLDHSDLIYNYFKVGFFLPIIGAVALYYTTPGSLLTSTQIGIGSLSNQNSSFSLSFIAKYLPALLATGYSAVSLHLAVNNVKETTSKECFSRAKKFSKFLPGLVVLMLPFVVNGIKLLIGSSVFHILAIFECITMPLVPLLLEYAVLIHYREIDQVQPDPENSPLEMKLLPQERVSEELPMKSQLSGSKREEEQKETNMRAADSTPRPKFHPVFQEDKLWESNENTQSQKLVANVEVFEELCLQHDSSNLHPIKELKEPNSSEESERINTAVRTDRKRNTWKRGLASMQILENIDASNLIEKANNDEKEGKVAELAEGENVKQENPGEKVENDSNAKN